MLFSLRAGAAAALAYMMLATGSGPSTAMEPAVDKNTIVFATGRDIAMLDAQVDNTGNSDRYHWQLFDNLYTFDASGNPAPQIAESVDISDDELQYRFTLREGVKFHNGEPVTAEDVKFSIERINDPDVKSTRRPYFSEVLDTVEVLDDLTVLVQLKRPDAVFLNKVAAFVAVVPKEYTESLPTTEAFSRAPIGAGPYMLVNHEPGQSLELRRFEEYYGEKPGVERLIFKVVPEESSRLNALITGEVDIADNIAPSDLDRLESTEGLEAMPVPLGSPLHIRIYSDDPETPLHDRRVRLALNYAIDIDAIIENLMHGVGKPLTSFISSYYPIGVDPDLEPYGYDPEKARTLLAEAGYPDGFSTTLLTPTTYPKQVAEAVAAYWSQVGVIAEISVLGFPAWSQLNNTHQSGPMTVMQYSNALNDPITPIHGTASETGTWSNYRNAEVQELIDRTESASNREERDQLFRQIGRLLRDDGHSVLISELHSVFAKKDDVVWEPQRGYAFYNLRNVGWK